jgi:hypothetical protein
MARTALKFFLLITLIHIGGMIVYPHIANRLLEMKVGEIVARSSRNSEQFIQERILEYAQEKKIPLARQDLHVWRQGKQLRVVIDYDRTVAIPFHPYELNMRIAIPPDAAPPGFRSRRR